jgi:DNA-binding NarL/FixJ family response regulator
VNATRVVVADDHLATRELIAGALADGGFDVVALARDAASVVSAVAEHEPDVAVLDIRMPGNGIVAAREIARRFPETAIVMLTVSTNDDDLFAAIAAGALGYVVKGVPAAELVEALHKVLDGETAMPPSMVRRLVEEFGRRERDQALRARRPKIATLSDREREVLELMAAGLTTRAIAARMFVRSHIAAILRKLEVPDRRAAVKLLDHLD